MRPVEIEEVQRIVREHPRLYVRGHGSKSGVYVEAEDAFPLDMSGLSGMVEYQPGEFTFTALAGTPLLKVERELTANDQYLPFDPPFAESGATLGGTIASGLSGSGRYRYGGCRDFLLGVKFVTGEGNLVTGGGKVVKNAAGFDLPKMMVGSLGMFGALVEATFKVFPRPQAYLTVRKNYPAIQSAIAAMVDLSRKSWEIHTLDLTPSESQCTLDVRIGGFQDGLITRAERIVRHLEQGEILTGEDEAAIWSGRREFSWLPEKSALVKVPITPFRLLELEQFLDTNGAARTYGVGGNLAWIGWPGEIPALDRELSEEALSGLVLRGGEGKPRLGRRPGESFYRRLKQALDPQNRWVEV